MNRRSLIKYALIVSVFTLIPALVAFSLRPVCVPITAEDLKDFNVPIEQRTDRDFYLQVFQRKESGWFQCKTWISRQFFF